MRVFGATCPYSSIFRHNNLRFNSAAPRLLIGQSTSVSGYDHKRQGTPASNLSSCSPPLHGSGFTVLWRACVLHIETFSFYPAVSVPILPPREIQALWPQNDDTQILVRCSAVSREYIAMTRGYDRYDTQMLAIQMRTKRRSKRLPTSTAPNFELI